MLRLRLFPSVSVRIFLDELSTQTDIENAPACSPYGEQVSYSQFKD